MNERKGNWQENRKNSVNPETATPSRAAHGCAEGVETSRLRGIARSNTAQASDAGNGDDIVRSAGKKTGGTCASMLKPRINSVPCQLPFRLSPKFCGLPALPTRTLR